MANVCFCLIRHSPFSFVVCTKILFCVCKIWTFTLKVNRLSAAIRWSFLEMQSQNYTTKCGKRLITRLMDVM